MIYKYVLKISDIQTVTMPFGAAILTAQMQGGKLCLWAQCDPEARTEERTIMIFGTGHPMPQSSRLAYIATAQDGKFVWHVYEQTKGE